MAERERETDGHACGVWDRSWLHCGIGGGGAANEFRGRIIWDDDDDEGDGEEGEGRPRSDDNDGDHGERDISCGDDFFVGGGPR